MSAECEIITETGAVTAVERITIGSDLQAVGAIAEAVLLTLALSLSSAGVGDSAIETGRDTVVRESALATSLITATNHTTSVIGESGRATEFLRTTLRVSLASTGAAVSLAPDVTRVSLSSGAVAQSLLTLKTSGSILVTESARAQSLFSNASTMTLQSTAAAASFVVPKAVVTKVVLETGLATSLLAQSADYGERALSSGVAGDNYTLKTIGRLVIEEQAVAEDEAVIDSQGGAWTSMFEGMAMSQLQFAPMQSAAFVGGVLHSTGDGGLYAFDSTLTEAGMVETDLLDMGNSRATYCYVGYSGDDVTLTVGNTEAGAEVSYSYPIDSRTADSPVPSRAKLGRGIKSRYWRFAVSGTRFDLHDLAIVNDTVSRRV